MAIANNYVSLNLVKAIIIKINRLMMMRMIDMFRMASAKNNQVKIITTKQNNIYLNIALEEYLFDKAEVKMPTLFIWRNTPTIVIGRHQNPWKQCKVEQTKRDNVLISRRKSGGGAVYQDLGNTCFSFFTPYKQHQEYDYRSVNNAIIINALQKLGIKGEISGRNDLVVNQKKFSGSAYRLSLGNKHGIGRKALHHGTIMFSVDFTALKNYLNPSKKKLESKGIQSVISRVVNLQQIDPTMNHQKFVPVFEQAFIEHYGNNNPIRQQITLDSLSNESKAIQQNFDRLKSWEWIYGECPYFKYTIEHKFPWGLFEITFEVENAIIHKCKIYSDCLYPEFVEKSNELMLGTKYDGEGIQMLKNRMQEQFRDNETYKKMAEQLCEWIKQQL